MRVQTRVVPTSIPRPLRSLPCRQRVEACCSTKRTNRWTCWPAFSTRSSRPGRSRRRPPISGPFLPEAGEIRRLTLVELIKVDLEYRWLNRGCPKRLAEYLAEFPELGKGRVPCDLIYEEFHIRKQSGQNVSAEEYLQAFPDQAAEIASILGVEQHYESSSFHKSTKQRAAGRRAAGRHDRRFRPAPRVGERRLRQGVSRPAAVDAAARRPQSGDRPSDEPQTLAQLDHDHIVRVYDQRTIPDRKLRLLYMQYIAGGTLQAVIQRVRQTPPEERTGKLLLDVIDESLERRGESRPSESSTAGLARPGELARSGLLAGGENRPGLGLRASARRAASRRETGQHPGHGRRSRPNWPTSISASATRSPARRRPPISAAAWRTCRPSNSRRATRRIRDSPRNSTDAAISIRWGSCCGSC